MEKRIYPAIFHPEDVGGYSLHFPDLPGCISEGDTLPEALEMAQDALGIYLYSLQQDKENFPEASKPESLKIDKGDFITLVEWDELEYLRRTDNKAVKKTLTLPAWMNTKAEELQINFSKTLQEAILQKINA